MDFAGHLKNEASIINFIAAYGTHALITGATTIEDKRDAAMTIITGAAVGGIARGSPTDRLAFLNATDAYAGGSLGGLETTSISGSAAWPKRSCPSAACSARPSTSSSKRSWRNCRTATVSITCNASTGSICFGDGEQLLRQA